MTYPDGLEPLFTLKVAAQRIPFVNTTSLKHWLRRHPEFPSRIMPMGRRSCRMLSESELVRIRALRVKIIRPASSRDSYLRAISMRRTNGNTIR